MRSGVEDMKGIALLALWLPRVAPNAPESWKNWRAQVPLPQGDLFITVANGKLAIRATDPRVKTIEAPESAVVEGARRASLSKTDVPEPKEWTAPTPIAVPAPRARSAATFSEDGVPTAALPGLPARRVSANDLARLDPADVGALVVAGNALPRKTRDGGDLQGALARYPCAARLVNRETGGELVLIPDSIARTPAGLDVLKNLLIKLDAAP